MGVTVLARVAYIYVMIYDLHNDILTSGESGGEIRQARREYPNAIFVFWSTSVAREVAFKAVAQAVKSAGKGRFYAIEDLHFLAEADIDKLLKLPLMYCSLTWNDNNALAGGAYGDGKLSNFGKSVIERLNSSNIALDLAHLNEKSFFQALERAKNPLDSHTAVFSQNTHPRNLKDCQIRALIASGGIVGLSPVASFLGGDSLEHYVNHIDAFLQKFGDNNLAIGTDFFGAKPLVGLENYNDFDQVKTALRDRKISDNTIDKIFYLNAQNFFEKIQKNSK